uniref:ATPase AAA-type core domain-containing protein n=1 Tax=viral metagenome TaxID=1070528 RepID=A0A6C0AZP7_9ZZZZ
MVHTLDHWKQYLTCEDDFNFLIQFVENAKNKEAVNQVMLLLAGPGGTGKSTLINEISEYLGSQNFILSDTYGSAFLQPVVQMIYIPGIDEYQKKYVQQLRNAIYFGQSVIAATNNLDKINKDILKSTRVIKMEHVFTK